MASRGSKLPRLLTMSKATERTSLLVTSRASCRSTCRCCWPPEVPLVDLSPEQHAEASRRAKMAAERLTVAQDPWFVVPLFYAALHHVMRDLKDVTTKGGTLYVFRLP